MDYDPVAVVVFVLIVRPSLTANAARCAYQYLSSSAGDGCPAASDVAGWMNVQSTVMARASISNTAASILSLRKISKTVTDHQQRSTCRFH